MSSEEIKTKIQAASREQLILMLYDGAMRFGEEAKEHIKKGGEPHTPEYEAAHSSLIRAQNIILELLYALDRKAGGTIADNLAGLYTYCYQRLVEANIRRDTSKIDECNSILKKLREAWADAVQKLKEREGKK